MSRRSNRRSADKPRPRGKPAGRHIAMFHTEERTMAKASAFESFFPANALVPPEAVRDYCNRTVNTAAELSRSLMSSFSQNLEGNFDLAARLINCSDPAEAMSAYREWMNARRDAILADSKGLAAQWLKLCDIDMDVIASATRRASEQAQSNVSAMPRAAAGD